MDRQIVMEPASFQPSQLIPRPLPTAGRTSLPARIFGCAMILVGIAGWWYNAHLAATTGQFSIKLCLLGPLGVFGGLVMLLRPDWAGPWRKDSTPAHKAALIAVISLVAITSGITFYLLKQPSRASARSSVIHWTPAMGTPVLPASRVAFPSRNATPSIQFQGQDYKLGSFSNKKNAMWEFVSGNETVNDWTTLVTVVDRPDARTRPELDRLAEGIMSTYKSGGARILAARTMQDESGAPFNYLVAAFDEPSKNRMELNFVKCVLGERNAAIAIYGVRITDQQDYRNLAKLFLDQHSAEVGRALGQFSLPDISRLPRTEF
jgi:hypothetical protein